MEAYAGEAAESAAESAAGEFQESQSTCGGELLTRKETFEEQCAKRSKDLRAQCGYRERPVDDSRDGGPSAWSGNGYQGEQVREESRRNTATFAYGCMGLWPDGSTR